MGRAIVRDPQVFLFDEPLSNLDAKLRIAMRTEIKRLHQQLSATSIYVTHDQVEAMTLGDRLIVLNHGRIEQEGAPLDIYNRPATSFVAAFIGSPPMNLYDVRRSGSRIEVDGCGEIPMELPSDLPECVRLGIRPEHLTPCADTEAQIRLVADIVEPQGSETIVHGSLGPNALVLRLEAARTVQAGEVIPVRFRPESAHFFDPETDRRIN